MDFNGSVASAGGSDSAPGDDATSSSRPFPSAAGPASLSPAPRRTVSDLDMGFMERSASAAGAAVLSAVLVNPLDVAKTRLQAQDAGVAYAPSYRSSIIRCMVLQRDKIFTNFKCSPSCTRASAYGTAVVCPPDCFTYKGTLDVFYKVIRQEGLSRLWRGTNAGLALAVPTVGIYLPCYDVFRNRLEDFTIANMPTLTPYVPLIAGSAARTLACISCYPIELARTRMQAFKGISNDVKPPGIWKTLVEVVSPLKSVHGPHNLQGYRILWMGVGAQLARDVPFSAICWSTLEPIRRKLLGLVDEDGNAASVLGANFSAGFVAGSLAAALTCPFDVAKTRRQIEKDPARALNMTTRQTMVEVLRERGVKGLFTGVGPRVGRAGPSVGIVVSFYELVKYALYRRYDDS